MVPPAGRPPKGNEKTGEAKHRSYRLTDETVRKIDECKNTIGLRDRTEVVEYAIHALYESVCGKQKEQ